MSRALPMVLLLAMTACSSVRPRTEVVVRIVADPGVARVADRLHVVVRGGPNRSEDSLATRSDREYPDEGSIAFPIELGLVPADGDVTRVFEVTATARRSDPGHTEVATARAISGYVEGNTLLLVLRLEDTCIDLPACDPGNTCHVAVCVDAYVDPRTLAPYSSAIPEMDTGGLAEAGALDAGPDVDADDDAPSFDANLDAPAFDANDDAPRADARGDAPLGDAEATDASADAGPRTWPRPVAPLSTSLVSTQTPTLRWANAAGTDGARVELCGDRDCASPIDQLDASGVSAIRTSVLPPGEVFWRLRSLAGGVVGTTVSPTWQLLVPYRTTSADAVWGTRLDVNGDGITDVAAGADTALAGVGQVHVYHGAPGGPLASSPTISVTTDVGGAFGWSIAAAGDRNGDGYGELIAGAPGPMTSPGRALVFAGGPSGIDAIPSEALRLGAPGERFATAVTGIGDVDGDGYADVAIGAHAASAGTGQIELSYGDGDEASGRISMTFMGGTANGRFGYALAAAGDVNGDGLADLAVGAPGSATVRGHVFVMLGDATDGLGSTIDLASSAPSGDEFGLALASAGDINDDGLPDLAIGAPGAGRVDLCVTDGTGFETTRIVLDGTALGPTAAFGISIASAGDLNADGWADLVVGASGTDAGAGSAFIYLGGSGGLPTIPSLTLDGPDGPSGQFGSWVSGVGDVNGDGHDDIAVAARGPAAGDGRVYLFLGNAGGTDLAPSITIESPDPGGTFGRSIASASEPMCRDPWSARAS